MRRWFRWRQEGAASATGDESGRDWASIQLADRGIRDASVLAAMRTVPRERFVPEDVRRMAYHDGALPIGKDQTISQPYIVALMTEALNLPAWSADHAGERPRVLDVGTGSGYQAAVLVEMGAEVTSIELDPELADRARVVLGELGYAVTLLVGDGGAGAPEAGPFAGILVAAAAPEVPQPLVEQLLPDGRLVLPIGSRREQLITVVRREDGLVTREPVEPAVFVPLLGEHGFTGH